MTCKTTSRTDKNGEMKVKAFYGKHRITVNGISKEVDLPGNAGQVIVEF